MMTRRVLGLAAAVVAAPALMLTIFLLLTSGVRSFGPADMLIAELLVLWCLAVALGFFGSATLLTVAFTILELRWKLRGPWLIAGPVLAGALSGAAHIALAFLQVHGPWVPGLELWFGTSFAASMIPRQPLFTLVAAMGAGAGAGLIYALIRSPPADPAIRAAD